MTPATDNITFLTPFGSKTYALDTGTTATTVLASFTDSGVTAVVSGTNLVLSGTYQSIIPVTWTYIDNNRATKTSSTIPTTGTYEKITKVDPPGLQTKTVTYTVGSDSLVVSVKLTTFDTVKNQLSTALAGAR
jgi:hypothetical protein